jgi:hypothetical protein
MFLFARGLGPFRLRATNAERVVVAGLSRQRIVESIHCRSTVLGLSGLLGAFRKTAVLVKGKRRKNEIY